MSTKNKNKKVNNIMVKEEITPPSSSFAADDQSSSSREIITEGTALTINQTTDENFLTLSGTIKRGNKAGQSVDVKVNVSRVELERLQENRTKLLTMDPVQSSSLSSLCSLSRGLHIFLWTVLCVPLVFVISSIYSFYLGTLTWYNIFSLYTDSALFYRVLAAPALVLTYPILILTVSLGLGIYSAVVQITYEWPIWLTKVRDFEKGFYSWLCQIVHLEECSPYTEVIIVNQLPSKV